MDRVTYCMPFLSYAGIANSVAAVMESDLQPRFIVVIDNSGKNLAHDYLREYVGNGQLYIIPQIKNLGVSRSWNQFMSMYDDYVIIANDDVAPHRHAIGELVTAAQNTLEEVFFCGSGASGNAFSFFLLRKEGWNEIGPFDHMSFNRGYFEDNDYILRLKAEGYSEIVVDNATYDHEISGTYKSLSEGEQILHHELFRQHEIKYKQKWGGLPLKETFSTPYNSGMELKEWHKRNVRL